MATLRKRKTKIPDDAIQLATYQELEKFVRAFASGHINLLIVVGEHGISKSTTVRESLPDTTCWIAGNPSAFGIYMKLFEFRDRFVVINDIDELQHNRQAVRLLKCLCETEETKTVAWPTAAKELKTEGIPKQFETQSRVIILSNDWYTSNRNVAAVQDRGHTIVFRPTAVEVHRKTAEWFNDEEIFEWLGQRLHLIAVPTMRLYYRARELKQAGMDWKNLIPLAEEDRRKRIALELISDSSFETQEARARTFTERGGGCRATFFNHLRRLR